MAQNNSKQRQRIKLPILGIDTSTPDLIAKNGVCTELNNLRYVDGAWRNTPQLGLTKTIPNNGSQSGDYYMPALVYKHPASAADKYIAWLRWHDEPNYWVLAEVSSNTTTIDDIYDDVTERESTILHVDNSAQQPDYKLSHFGSVLIIATGEELLYFIYSDGTYTQFISPAPPTVSVTGKDIHKIDPLLCDYEIKSTNNLWQQQLNQKYSSTPNNLRTLSQQSIPNAHYTALRYAVVDIDSKTTLLVANDGNNDAWNGEMLFFVCYKMKDGTTLSPSSLQLCASEELNSIAKRTSFTILSHSNTNNHKIFFTQASYNSTEDVYLKDDLKPDQLLHRILPTIEISIPNAEFAQLSTELIAGVTVYATRINSIFNYEYIASGAITAFITAEDREKCFIDNDLPNQPFYKVKDISLDEFAEGINSDKIYSMTLGYSLMSAIINNSLYEPNQNLHHIYSENLFEYNNRLHLGGTRTKLFAGYSTQQCIDGTDADGKKPYIFVKIHKNGRSYSVKVSNDNNCIAQSYGVAYQHIISYPDYNAEELEVYNELNDDVGHHISWTIADSRTLSKAMAINFTYFLPKPSFCVKFPIITFPASITNRTPYSYGDIVDEPNRLQVSDANNCFALPFDTSYKVGSPESSIIAINTIADMLADSKYGQFPLYVFTSDGIWALESGSGEVLYANFVIVNHDIIVNRHTAVANYNVFYFTTRGINALSGRQAALISSPIDTEFGSSRDFTDSVMYVQHLFGELIVRLPSQNKMMVFNPEQKVWSTRDNFGEKLNDDTVIVADEQALSLYNLESEQNPAAVSINIITRPVKLSDAQFARIEAAIARLQASTNANILFKLEGSNNLENWLVLHEHTFTGKQDLILRYVPITVKYFRITLSSTITGSIEVSNFDILFYNRYLHDFR